MGNAARPTASPLVLRLLLGVIFIWAGLGKMMGTVTFTGADAARMGELRGVSPAEDPTTARRVQALALGIDRAARPTEGRAWWVSGLGPVRVSPGLQAWGVAIAEVAAGMLLVLGLFTRVGAGLVVGVMAGAVWITQVGPAIASGQTLLGVLPKRDVGDLSQWTGLLLQGTLLVVAVVVGMLGPGRVSMDARMFTRGHEEASASK